MKAFRLFYSERRKDKRTNVSYVGCINVPNWKRLQIVTDFSLRDFEVHEFEKCKGRYYACNMYKYSYDNYF